MSGKKKLCKRMAGLLPIFFVLGHNTANCIMTQLGWAHARGATTRPAASHDKANKGRQHGQPTRGVSSSAHVRPGHWGCVTIQNFVS